MANAPAAISASDPGQPGDETQLDELIRRDQLAAVRRSLSITIPVNVLLSAITAGVFAHRGESFIAVVWFAAASVVNLLRFAQCRRDGSRTASGAEGALRGAAHLSFLSGLVWACLPLLALGGSTEAVFHVIVGAGITGGSIAMGFAYAPVAIAFVAPILVAHFVYFALSGSFEQQCVAVTIAIYLAALVKSALQSETTFRATTRLKHEATALAFSLNAANAKATAVAEEMRHLALHDPLTGLLNRRGFLRELEQRSTGACPDCCVMLLDLSAFRSINDVFGNAVGDQVLVEVADRMRALLRQEAVIARVGADEFAVILDADAAEFDPQRVVDDLLAALGKPFACFDQGRIGLCVGIYQGALSDAANVLGYADEALCAAKEAGRNHYRFFDAPLRRRLETRRDSERDLLGALRDGSLQVWYQPIFGEDGRRLAAVEALVRWNHPRHGWIAPAEIMKAAALAGQAEPLFGFIADRVCDMAGQLRALGRTGVAVAMNVSPRELSQLPIVSLLLGRLRSAELPADSIEIEITEETALDIGAVEGKLAGLAAAGVRIAVDDFGVGYSSLATLRQFHADRIKIDRCFVTGLTESDEKRSLVQAVIGLGHAMNMEVVAEGVESSEDVASLRALGCQFMQGYHLGRPMPADILLASLQDGATSRAAGAA